MIDSAGRKWIGTKGAGVSMLDDNGTPLDKTDDRWVTFTVGDGLVNGYVTRIAIDRYGRKWFATERGISVLDDGGTPFDKGDDEWVTYTTAQGLAGNYTVSVVFEGADRVWVGTNAGLSVLSPLPSPRQ